MEFTHALYKQVIIDAITIEAIYIQNMQGGNFNCFIVDSTVLRPINCAGYEKIKVMRSNEKMIA